MTTETVYVIFTVLRVSYGSVIFPHCEQIYSFNFQINYESIIIKMRNITLKMLQHVDYVTMKKYGFKIFLFQNW